uniref:Uncharacterized protein n=1 Tax=Glossina palpalis gambiensis TaxID=67801 RepID=A0A1B0B5R2_9MUSC
MLVVIFTKQKSCEIKSLGQSASCLVNDFLILPWLTLPTLASSSRNQERLSRHGGSYDSSSNYVMK